MSSLLFSIILKLKDDDAHIGFYQKASARNTHFNDDNHLQNDTYPFYYNFFSGPSKLL